MKAKYYIYRNLNKGGFSVKYRGKVIAVEDSIEAIDAEFRVSEAGRTRAIRDGRRNVHAFVACKNWKINEKVNVHQMTPVWYNPFKTETFKAGNKPIHESKKVYFRDGKCFV